MKQLVQMSALKKQQVLLLLHLFTCHSAGKVRLIFSLPCLVLERDRMFLFPGSDIPRLQDSLYLWWLMSRAAVAMTQLLLVATTVVAGDLLFSICHPVSVSSPLLVGLDLLPHVCNVGLLPFPNRLHILGKLHVGFWGFLLSARHPIVLRTSCGT